MNLLLRSRSIPRSRKRAFAQRTRRQASQAAIESPPLTAVKLDAQWHRENTIQKQRNVCQTDQYSFDREIAIAQPKAHNVYIKN
ncbi:hypothetical protein AGR7B_pAt0339 [Agrobacterium deltaense RV3]|nr:hypothetical protein AGR7B_pAt0339 [Agrobacterium deltaense RV3]